MTSISTEQRLPFGFQVTDGRGRPKPLDTSNGPPTAASSDETVCTVTVEPGEGTAWKGWITSVAPGTARVVIDADADLGEGVDDVVGTLDIEVTLDPRTGARMVALTPGTPEDKPA